MNPPSPSILPAAGLVRKTESGRHDGGMNEPHQVRHLKRALGIVRDGQGRVAGTAVALVAAGRPVLATTAALARGLSEGRHELIRLGVPDVLAVDEEAALGLLELPGDSGLQPLKALAVAPAEDGEPLLGTGAGLTVPTQGGHHRHLWVTRSSRLAGRLHAFVGGEKQAEFRYLLDLAPGHLPPGSPLLRSADGALVALVAEAEAPGPGLTLGLPVREVAALVQRLG